MKEGKNYKELQKGGEKEKKEREKRKRRRSRRRWRRGGK